MNGKSMKGGDKLHRKITVIFQSFLSDFIWKENVLKIRKICNAEKSGSIGVELSIERFKNNLKRKKIFRRNIAVAVISIIVLLFGAVAIANRGRIFSRVSKSNEITYSTDEKPVAIDNVELKHDSLEAVAKHFKIYLPVLTEFPEALTTKEVSTYENVTTIRINAIYQNSVGDEKIKIRYTYCKDTNKYQPDVKTNINPTYDAVNENDVLGNLTEQYSDMERRIVAFDYYDYIINLETKYTQGQLTDILKNIVILKEYQK